MTDASTSSNQCAHAQIKRDTHGWRCDDCLRTFFPSGDTGAEQAAVRLRASVSRILDMAVTAGYDAGHAGIEAECRKALDDARNAVETSDVMYTKADVEALLAIALAARAKVRHDACKHPIAWRTQAVCGICLKEVGEI